MSRDRNYQRLLNTKRWQEVRAMVWERANGLCEQCKEEGRITQGIDCHHIVPVESARTIQEMEQLCFNPNNIRLLCIRHHIDVHTKAKTHTKAEVQASRERRADRRRQEIEERWERLRSAREEKNPGGID